MITLYSYPELFGVADNNPYGLKVYAFLKLSQLAFAHEHIFDTKLAPRGQLPYIVAKLSTICRRLNRTLPLARIKHWSSSQKYDDACN